MNQPNSLPIKTNAYLSKLVYVPLLILPINLKVILETAQFQPVFQFLRPAIKPHSQGLKYHKCPFLISPHFERLLRLSAMG